MEKILEALKASIAALGAEVILMPQDAKTSGKRVELYPSGISLGGASKANQSGKAWETVKFKAEVKSDGSHQSWLTETISFARNFAALEEESLPVAVVVDAKTYHLAAHWKRLQEGRFEYPDEEAGVSMPVAYVEVWQVDLSYPAAIAE